jgi:hypothetical protein
MVISIPILIAAVGIIFSSGRFYGQAKKNEQNLEDVNEKLDTLTNIVHRIQIDFAIWRGQCYNCPSYKSIGKDAERRDRQGTD